MADTGSDPVLRAEYLADFLCFFGGFDNHENCHVEVCYPNENNQVLVRKLQHVALLQLWGDIDIRFRL